MPDEHDEMLQDWRENAAADEDDNFHFLHRLKTSRNPRLIDNLARQLHEQIFARIDCTRCANCCKTMQPFFTEEDVARIAARMGMTKEAFVATYLEFDEEERAFRTKAMPCPFLGSDDRCTIYDVRPEACREFPHTDKKGFTSRVYLHTANTLTCPATYHVVTGLQLRLRRR